MARPRGSTQAKCLIREAAKQSLLDTSRRALQGDEAAQRELLRLTGKECLESLVKAR